MYTHINLHYHFDNKHQGFSRFNIINKPAREVRKKSHFINQNEIPIMTLQHHSLSVKDFKGWSSTAVCYDA